MQILDTNWIERQDKIIIFWPSYISTFLGELNCVIDNLAS